MKQLSEEEKQRKASWFRRLCMERKKARQELIEQKIDPEVVDSSLGKMTAGEREDLCRRRIMSERWSTERGQLQLALLNGKLNKSA